MWNIRPARDEDAAALSAVAQRIFYDTFGPSNSEKDMDLYCSEAFTPAVMAAEISSPNTEVIVAVVDNRLIGFTQIHHGQAPSTVTGRSPAELRRFYVVRAWQGTGLAMDLMAAAAKRSLEYGAEALWLGVWEKNARAIRFYEKCGFATVDEHPFLLGTDTQRDLIMSAPINTLSLAPPVH